MKNMVKKISFVSCTFGASLMVFSCSSKNESISKDDLLKEKQAQITKSPNKLDIKVNISCNLANQDPGYPHDNVSYKIVNLDKEPVDCLFRKYDFYGNTVNPKVGFLGTTSKSILPTAEAIPGTIPFDNMKDFPQNGVVVTVECTSSTDAENKKVFNFVEAINTCPAQISNK